MTLDIGGNNLFKNGTITVLPFWSINEFKEETMNAEYKIVEMCITIQVWNEIFTLRLVQVLRKIYRIHEKPRE